LNESARRKLLTIKPAAQEIRHLYQLLSTRHLGQVLFLCAENKHELVANFRYDIAILAAGEKIFLTIIVRWLELGL